MLRRNDRFLVLFGSFVGIFKPNLIGRSSHSKLKMIDLQVLEVVYLILTRNMRMAVDNPVRRSKATPGKQVNDAFAKRSMVSRFWLTASPSDNAELHHGRVIGPTLSL
jgi:hypothetical protein